MKNRFSRSIFFNSTFSFLLVFFTLSTDLFSAVDKHPSFTSEFFTFYQNFSDLEIELWANSPKLYNPTSIDVDIEGRVWVAEAINYRRKEPRPQGDRIVVLTDTDNDGIADKSHVFVQEKMLHAPLGVAVLDNVIYVSCSPYLIAYTDVNRNAKFDANKDTKEILLKNIGKINHDHSLHSGTLGPNGQLYFNVGNMGANTTDKDGWQLNLGSFSGFQHIAGKPSGDGHIYIGGAALRMNLNGTGLRVIGHNLRNSYEQAVDSFGDVFQSDNDDPRNCRVTWLMEYGNLGFTSYPDGKKPWQVTRRPGQSSKIAHWRQEDPGTIPAGDVYGLGSPTGVVLYEGDQLGQKYRGMLLACEPARNVIFSYYPQLKKNKSGFVLGKRFNFVTTNPKKKYVGTDTTGKEKATSSKNLNLLKRKTALGSFFRPADIAIGTDGAIYIADWYDSRVGGHATYDEHYSGAIYRIKLKGKTMRSPKLKLKTYRQQLEAFRSSAVNVRGTAYLKLKVNPDKDKIIANLKARFLKDKNPYLRARALWLLAELDAKEIRTVEDILSDTSKSEKMRITAYRIIRHVLGEGHKKLLKYAQKFQNDLSLGLRREILISLRNYSLDSKIEIIAELAKRFNPQDRHYVEAIGIACAKEEEAAYQLLLEKIGSENPLTWSPQFFQIAWRLHNKNNVKDFGKLIQSAELKERQKKQAVVAIGLLSDEAAFKTMAELYKISDSFPISVRTEINWFMNANSLDLWSDYTNLKIKTIDKDYVVSIPDEYPETASVEEIIALKGNAQRGKIAFTACYTCHRMKDQGIEFGPDLTDWGRTQPLETIVAAIINPDQDIAHSYRTLELKLNNGKKIEGFLEGRTKKVLFVRVYGGRTLNIDTKQLGKGTFLPKKSLMIAGQGLGLKEQQIRDIAEYLKEGD